MAKEIERRFEVKDGLLEEVMAEASEALIIHQAYIGVDTTSHVRIRQTIRTRPTLDAPVFTITAKRGQGLVRDEEEQELKPDIFSALWLSCQYRFTKIRYRVKV